MVACIYKSISLYDINQTKINWYWCLNIADKVYVAITKKENKDKMGHLFPYFGIHDISKQCQFQVLPHVLKLSQK